ncbi:pyridoxamine 5'-phosphate oxidase family protein [Flavobacterium wongokense]|uniref:pyridoxamine 5'-phosphate oxidase family protein n=1 Tax=Flavobacterium wongokense TaxID=2910674 RepID=UPI001F34D973|nr:pyridoxamine 5'-phosphate oxidase family protein [Flavobacterium sp. WG47]MCF6132984.1 pyridoxamine 5'-phosphate oxidase family protein [Flavobacterium sp. WG47]
MSKENLFNAKAIEKLKELSGKAKTCMFITNLSDKSPHNSRPMGLQECDGEGNFWFISSKESGKNIQIEKDNEVQLYFMNNSDHEYLSILGKAYIYDDRKTIEEKWSVVANAWFDGKDDPDVSIIRVTPEEAYYWDTKFGKFVSMINFISVIIGGKNTDNSDGVEGKIKLTKP